MRRRRWQSDVIAVPCGQNNKELSWEAQRLLTCLRRTLIHALAYLLSSKSQQILKIHVFPRMLLCLWTSGGWSLKVCGVIEWSGKTPNDTASYSGRLHSRWTPLSVVISSNLAQYEPLIALWVTCIPVSHQALTACPLQFHSLLWKLRHHRFPPCRVLQRAEHKKVALWHVCVEGKW